MQQPSLFQPAPIAQHPNDPLSRVATPTEPHFDGATYEPKHDAKRLGTQLVAVFNLMQDGAWRTLAEIVAAIPSGSEAAVSARLRDFRKVRFGEHRVDSERRSGGTYVYRLVPNGPLRVQ